MDPCGLKCHSQEEVKDLRWTFVNSGTLRFARIKITTNQTDEEYLSASVHEDLIYTEFLYEVISRCQSYNWFQHEKRPTWDLVDAARVKHAKFNPPKSWPTDKELKLVKTTSAKSTVGSVFSQITTSIDNSYPNVLEISFVRRSSRSTRLEVEQVKEDNGVPRKKAESPSTPTAQQGSPKKQPHKKPTVTRKISKCSTRRPVTEQQKEMGEESEEEEWKSDDEDEEEEEEDNTLSRKKASSHTTHRGRRRSPKKQPSPKKSPPPRKEQSESSQVSYIPFLFHNIYLSSHNIILTSNNVFYRITLFIYQFLSQKKVVSRGRLNNPIKRRRKRRMTQLPQLSKLNKLPLRFPSRTTTLPRAITVSRQYYFPQSN